MELLPPAVDLIEGRRQVPTRTLTGTLDDPNTGLWLQPRLATAAADVERAIAAAHAVHLSRSWADLGVEGRAEALLSLAGELADRAGRLALAEAINTGTVIALTTPITQGCSDQVRGLVAQLRATGTVQELPGRGRGGPVRLRRDPWGPAAVLAPWNAPAPIAVARSAAALAAGCPVILKPSEWAPGSCDLLADAVVAAGLPAGVFQLVHGAGEVGAQLTRDERIRAIALTGGQATGRSIAAAAAPHFTRLQLELGGNNPVIVREDADVALTARALARGMTILNGQWCEGPGRVFVPARLHDPLVEALLTELSEVVIGPSTEPGSAMGPIAHRAHRDHLLGRIDALTAAGGRALTATTEPPDRGWFLAPTVVVGVDSTQAMAEIFGPVVTLHPVHDDAQALAEANASPDGLAGYVFGTDTGAALALGERLRGGEIKVNGTSLFDLTAASHQSFWGTSGHGGHGDGEALEFFRGNRIVGVDDPDAPV
jgi:phenylacetaldehyde dehydrogenase